MSDNLPGGGEKTEAPTPKRLQDSAKKGNVLQSKELGGAMVVVAGDETQRGEIKSVKWT